MRTLTLVLGGARSGKTRYAQEAAAQRAGPVLYVATAEAGDSEMAERIAAHRAERPARWATLEAPLNVGAAIQRVTPAPAVVVVDCLTLLANNVIVPLPEDASQAEADAALMGEVDGLLAAYATGEAEWLVVSNEVGLGLVPPYPLGRVYRDALGRANQRLAAAADNVLFMVAGLPLVVKGRALE
ncbi:MAG: bifunctional adenosylcobinamide kinase/adenosylcobinamide-phosphate guanylyltransferase [Anaerolineales bacterium]|nr:bifunctional adenosylcobinamide kinase/adenosylcobinamide-phosphate guanylyltransferase [Anaerolineales bacterium]